MRVWDYFASLIFNQTLTIGILISIQIIDDLEKFNSLISKWINRILERGTIEVNLCFCKLKKHLMQLLLSGKAWNSLSH